MVWKLVIGLGSSLVILYSSACMFLYLKQARFIFFPSPVIQQTPATFGLAYEAVRIPVGEGQDRPEIQGWWVPASRSRGVVLYFHGNGSNLGTNAERILAFQALDLSVLMVDYRGYGQSDGPFPSEQRVYEDALASWRYLTEVRGVDPSEILLYGHSLGGAVTIDLAARQSGMAGIILEGTFTSIREMVDRSPQYRIFPIGLLLTQQFDSLAKMPKVQAPALFLHGDADSVVPLEMSQRLYAVAQGPKQIQVFSGVGHDVIAQSRSQFLKAMRDFLSLIGKEQPSQAR